MNLGCGSIQPPDWTNVDKDPEFVNYQGERPLQIIDVVQGLPWLDDSVDYIVMHHSLQQITHHDLPLALAEIRRVLKPEGVLRVSVPDVFMAFTQYAAEERDWFPNAANHEGEPIGNVFATYVSWYGTNPTLFTFEYLRDRIESGGFERTSPAAFGKSFFSLDEGITELDAREPESIFMEAQKT